MKKRAMTVDPIIILSATSALTAGFAWASEHLNNAGGFVVLLSVAALNFAKAYKEYKTADKPEPKKNESDESTSN